MERLIGEGTKTLESLKRVVSRNTRLNMQVGKGAVAPKKVYRFPSPASQPQQEENDIHLVHEWTPQAKYSMFYIIPPGSFSYFLADKAMHNRDSEFNRQREFHPRMNLSLLLLLSSTNSLVTDQRNLFNMSFETLPPEPIYNVLVFQETVYDTADGFKKTLHEVPEERRDWRE
jgi:hypothetical protein